MEKLKKSEMMSLKVVVAIAALLIITPLLSASIRFKYLYFIVNILVMALGAEAGLFSFFFQSDQDQFATNSVVVKAPNPSAISDKYDEKPDMDEKMSSSDEAKMKKCGSETSIFFIGDDNNDDADEEVVVDEDLSDQELYHKAEIFIGNFYKQLKMQREESWKKLHHLSHNAS